jgi:hypothetical protein
MPTGRYCQVCDGVCLASVPTAQRAAVESELAELRRYRQREPLVQEFLTALRECPHDDALDELCARCGEKYDRLRGFKI